VKSCGVLGDLIIDIHQHIFLGVVNEKDAQMLKWSFVINAAINGNGVAFAAMNIPGSEQKSPKSPFGG